ncbi:MAG: acylphosphatase [Deltaproteobacteria bacterium]|nr:acylphosphatase [Deltaproteobacteria bacterium]
MEKVRAHLIISGRVQGVCFRMVAQEEALNRRLRGWVRNLPTGTVELVMEGEKKEVDEMITWCHQGPPAARVKNVQTNWENYSGEFVDFKVM